MPRAMERTPRLPSSLGQLTMETTARCRVAGATLLRADAATIAQARRQPIAVGTEKLAVSILKHADDQTMLALLAVLEALEIHRWRDQSFADWGVIAAPTFFGRVNSALAIQRYRQEGAWGVSPHLIPHQSLHASSGTISQLLKIHGPNFGVGGGPNPAPDSLLFAAALLADGSLPGLWLIVTGHESEWIPAADGAAVPPPICQAAALALTPWQPHGDGPQLSIGQLRFGTNAAGALAHVPEFHLNLLAEEWTASAGLPIGRWRLGEAHCLEIDVEARA